MTADAQLGASATGDAPTGDAASGTGGDSASGPGAVVLDPPPADPADPQAVDSNDLQLDSFYMIEFQYDSLPGHYFYAPQIHVTAPSGTLTVTRLDVTFPDATASPPFCSSGMPVTSAGRDLVGEIYGDWELTYDYGDGHQASGNFTLKITYVDGGAQVHTLSVEGAIVPGGLPTTYTGGYSSMNPGSC